MHDHEKEAMYPQKRMELFEEYLLEREKIDEKYKAANLTAGRLDNGSEIREVKALNELFGNSEKEIRRTILKNGYRSS